MKIYKLDQSQLDREKKSIILMYGITLLVLVALAVSINMGRETMQSLVWLIPLMVIMYAFMGFRSYKQRKAFYEGYSLELTEDSLVQNQPRMRELKFPLADITVVEVQKKGMLISIKQAKNVLGVSKDTMKPEDYEELKETLIEWVKRNDNKSEESMELLDDQPIESTFSEAQDEAEEAVVNVEDAVEPSEEESDDNNA